MNHAKHSLGFDPAESLQNLRREQASRGGTALAEPQSIRAKEPCMGMPHVVRQSVLPDLASLSDCRTLVQTFYERVRKDVVLAPVFAARIPDAAWPAHLERMAAFWATVLFGVPLFHGNPVASHRGLPITQHHFERWLALWSDTIDELFVGPVAHEAKQRARRMARVLGERIEAV